MKIYNDIYIVFEEGAEDYGIRGVFSSQHLAHRFKTALSEKDEFRPFVVLSFKLNSMEV